jgi:2-polyprenyl-3-methyl-5-hydroxy-6-metoxy-1,4-benzoquinol methylase
VIQFRCPLCEGLSYKIFSIAKDYEYGTSNESYRYLECNDCNCVYIENQPIEKISEIYPNNYYSTSSLDVGKLGLFSLIKRVKFFLDKVLFARILRKIKSEKISCLDVGGGYGWLLSSLRAMDERIKSTVVIDLSEASRGYAEEAGHVFICSTIESSRLEQKFDLILMLNLIEHVSSPKVALEIAYKYLNNDGFLLIKTPNTQSLNRKIFQYKYWGGLHAPRHWVLFNKKNFSKLAFSLGFTVEKFSYTQGAPQWAASIFGSLFINNPENSKTCPVDSRKSFQILLIVFALIDFILLPFLKTDQMLFLLKKPS